MSEKKRWWIEGRVSDYWVLRDERGATIIYFDEIDEETGYWNILRKNHHIASLNRKDSEIVNLDDFRRHEQER